MLGLLREFDLKDFSSPDYLQRSSSKLSHQQMEELVSIIDSTLSTSAKRILLTGKPGTGKSSLAKRLAKYWQIPHLEVDQIYWQSKKGGKQNPLFWEELRMRLLEPSLIIEGHFSKICPLLTKAEINFHLHLEASPLCLIKRLAIRDFRELIQGKRSSSDLAFLLFH